MIRFLGCVLVAAGGGYWGVRAAAQQRREEEDLRKLLLALELLERELSLRMTPMPRLLGQLSLRCPAPAGAFFGSCAERMNQGTPLSVVWREEVDQVPGLDEESRALLYPLGQVLGRYEAEGQGEAIAGVRRELELLCRRRGEESRRLGRVYRALGLTGGAFLVILLL